MGSRNGRILAAAGGLTMGLLCTGSAFAAGPPVPSSAGTVESTVRQGPVLQAPKSLPADVTAPPAVKPKVAPGGQAIPIKGFVVEGNTVLEQAAIDAVVGKYAGKSLTLAQIYDVADELGAAYRAAGYSLATVTVPPQKISDGNIRLQVVEGRIEEVAFAGKTRYRDGFLAEQTARLRPGDVITLKTMEHEMLLLNDLPGLSARSVIRPGRAYGTSQILINTQEKLYDGYLSGTNYGREDVGEKRLEGGVAFNNLAGIGDRLNFDFMESEHDLLTYGNIGYSIPVNTSGSRLAFSLSNVEFKIGGRLKPLGINGSTRIARLQFSHPLIRTRDQNLLFGLGLTRKHSETVVSFLRDAGIGGRALNGRTSDADLDLLDLSLLWSKVHADLSVTNVSAVFWTNFQHRDAGDGNLSRDGFEADEGRQAGKLRIDASHLRALPWWKLQLYLRGAAVLSFDPLLDSEKFGIGGPADVRGFPIAEVRGDSGFSVTTELRRAFAWGKYLQGTGRVFWDAGRVHRQEPAPGFRNHASLTSTGAGVTFALPYNTSLDWSVAFPLNGRGSSDGVGSGDGRFWGNITTRF